MPIPSKETLEQMTLFPRRNTLQEVIDEGIASLPIIDSNALLALLYLQQNTLVYLAKQNEENWVPQSEWDHHPDFEVDEWIYAVSNEDTRQSYSEWVNSQLEEQGNE